jgi:hypothetical protein
MMQKKQRTEFSSFLDPLSSNSEHFNAFSSLIGYLSIMIGVRGEYDQKKINSMNSKGSEIRNNQWYGFFEL